MEYVGPHTYELDVHFVREMLHEMARNLSVDGPRNKFILLSSHMNREQCVKSGFLTWQYFQIYSGDFKYITRTKNLPALYNITPSDYHFHLVNSIEYLHDFQILLCSLSYKIGTTLLVLYIVSLHFFIQLLLFLAFYIFIKCKCQKNLLRLVCSAWNWIWLEHLGF